MESTATQVNQETHSVAPADFLANYREELERMRAEARAEINKIRGEVSQIRQTSFGPVSTPASEAASTNAEQLGGVGDVASDAMGSLTAAKAEIKNELAHWKEELQMFKNSMKQSLKQAVEAPSQPPNE